MLRGYHIGEEITIVSKGIQRSSYTPNNTWIDERQKGRTSYFKIEKIGTTYLYGKYIRFEEDRKEICYYQSRINPKDYNIFSGIRRDLHKKHTDFINNLNEYEKNRENRRRDLERKAHRLTDVFLKIWEKQNPRPKIEA